MSKYCKAYALRVTYLDCMECETKECKRKGNKMVKRYLQLESEQKVFLVFASKREGYKDNVVIRCHVREATIRKETTIYTLETEKVVTKNLSGNVVETFYVPMHRLIQDIEVYKWAYIQCSQQKKNVWSG